MLEGLLSRRVPANRRAELEASLECPPMPRALDYLWRIFCRMRRRKGSNGYSQMPLEWPDIDAFLRRTQTVLAPWELEVVEELDDLFLKAAAQSKATPQDG